jgi:Na+-transporting NADH:ubiquinone oxidoreductase subunit C
MNTNNNLYTIVYATIMVVVVAVILAFASSLLKERQQRNVEIERKEMILRSVQLGADQAARANDKDSYIEAEYAKYIKDSSINEQGKDLTLYICTIENGERFYIIPLRGVGLWGPVWGYISLKGDFNTVYGATFDHKSETPGLGAEITTPAFYDQFENKKIFDKSGNYVSVLVVKGGADASNPHEVDAISGGTITSKAVEEMLFKNIKEYTTFFAAKLKEAEERAAEAALQMQQSDSTAVTPALQVNIQ